VEFFHLTNLLVLARFGVGEDRSCSLDTFFCSDAGQHLLLMILHLHLQHHTSLSDFPSMQPCLLRQFYFVLPVAYFCGLVPNDFRFSIHQLGEGNVARAIDFKVIILFWYNMEENEIESGIPHFMTVDNFIDLG
jgi:hypothetical protein